MSYYLFTDDTGKKLAIKEFETRGRAHDDEGNLTKGAPGMQAEAYRLTLQKKLKKQVVAWNHLGGKNPDPIV